MEIFVANEQSDEAIDLDRIRMLAEEVLKSEDVPSPCEVSIICVDEDSMRSLCRRFLGIDEATDVLAFPIDGEIEEETVETGPGGRVIWPEDGPVVLGDVVVCPAVSRDYAERHGRDFQREIDEVVVHGLLHLLGYDHAGQEERSAMDDRQRKLVEKFAAKFEGVDREQ